MNKHIKRYDLVLCGDTCCAKMVEAEGGDYVPFAYAYKHWGRAIELESLIGKPPEGSHADEWMPRAATWHEERLNWIAEAERLRKVAHDFLAFIEDCAHDDLDRISPGMRERAAKLLAKGVVHDSPPLRCPICHLPETAGKYERECDCAERGLRL